MTWRAFLGVVAGAIIIAGALAYRGKSVVVRVNDRGPYIKGRDLDLSRAAAQRIGLIAAGYDTVQICRL